MKTIPVLTLLLLMQHVAVANSDADMRIDWSEASRNAGGGKGFVQLRSGEMLATRTVYGQERRIVCSRSADGGETWTDISVIDTAPSSYDIGDGHLVELPTGEILYSYRYNLTTRAGPRTYSIRVAISADGGSTWRPHSIVAESEMAQNDPPDALRGLWSSFLLMKSDGTLQCYYDDEDTPHREGFARHQWLTMKSWDPPTRSWTHPVTVSRAHDPAMLSRDGMASAVELPTGELLCAFESVQTTPPFANCIRYVTRSDGGATWSWTQHERRVLYEPTDQSYLAISPWLARTREGAIVCVFATDEDREVPGKSGTPPRQLALDIKWVASVDDGRTWSRQAQTLFIQTHRSYAPGIIELHDGALLVMFYDYSTNAHYSVVGKVAR